MNQRELNTFKRKYFNMSKVKHKNIICHDPNTAPEHRRLTNDICEWLRCNKFVFYTRVFMKWNEIVDIVAPDLPRPIIEVRHSELKKDKNYNSDYEHMRIYIDTTDPFKLL